jgi:hypothetical protein
MIASQQREWQDTTMKEQATSDTSCAAAGSGIAAAAAIAAITLAFMLPITARAQAAGVDADAAKILRRMTDYVGQLQRFSVDTAGTLEVVLASGQKIQFTSAARNSLQRPNKIRSERIGDVVSQTFYFDGRTLTIFNPGDGYYATVPAPGTIDAAVDFARDSLDIIAPAGDLVTMDAYDRLMADATVGFVVGQSIVGGVRCDHLAFRSGVVDWQIWIEAGDKPLPRKYVITSLDVDQAPQFELMMSNWSTDPVFTAGHFQFTPPPGAKAIEFLPVGTAGATP